MNDLILVLVTTTRRLVNPQGCARDAPQKRALQRLVKRQECVALVWKETAAPSGRFGRALACAYHHLMGLALAAARR
jgi:hypothetical protein